MRLRWLKFDHGDLIDRNTGELLIRSDRRLFDLIDLIKRLLSLKGGRS